MSRTLPKVSVVIACREVKDVLERTIVSVLNQTYPNLECLVVDGASEDGSLDIIRRYEDRLSWWLSEPDNGPFDAMNKAIDHIRSSATKEEHWVCFLMGGDCFADDEVVVKVFSQEKLDYSKLKVIGGASILEEKATMAEQEDATESSEMTFAAKIMPALPPTVIPERMPFWQCASFVRLEESCFDKDYQFAGGYSQLYHIYYKYGAQSIASMDFPVAKPYLQNPWRKYYKRYITGEKLGIQSEHFSWHWMVTYLKWKWLWWGSKQTIDAE